MALKISIIIPSYNVEKYIERCLISTVRQDLPHCEYEVIVINDGSTDGTLGLMETFAERYSNIKVVDKKNEGLSATRNCGIDLSIGEYILFLDSDDCIAENCLKTIYDKAHNDQLDILECDFLRVDENNKELNNCLFPGNVRLPEGYVANGREALLFQKVLIPMVWIRIYRRAFLVDHDLRMVHIRHEDEEFTPRALCFAQRIEYLPLPFYIYTTREGSIMTNYCDQSYFDMITAMKNVYEFMKIHVSKEEINLRNYLFYHIQMILKIVYERSVRNDRPIQQKMILMMKEAGICPKKIRRCDFLASLIYRTPDRYLNYWKRRYSESKIWHLK